jgi:hypothetical protein
MVLSFWSLLPRERRACGLLRLYEAVEAAGEDGKDKKKGRKRPKKPAQAEAERRALCGVTREVAPALLELLLPLSLATLALARPQPSPRPYAEIQAAMVSLAQGLRLAHASRGRGRMLGAALKAATVGLAAVQWQVERCVSWRSRAEEGAGGEGEGEEAGGVMQGAEQQYAVAHVDALMQVSGRRLCFDPLPLPCTLPIDSVIYWPAHSMPSGKLRRTRSSWRRWFFTWWML